MPTLTTLKQVKTFVYSLVDKPALASVDSTSLHDNSGSDFFLCIYYYHSLKFCWGLTFAVEPTLMGVPTLAAISNRLGLSWSNCIKKTFWLLVGHLSLKYLLCNTVYWCTLLNNKLFSIYLAIKFGYNLVKSGSKNTTLFTGVNIKALKAQKQTVGWFFSQNNGCHYYIKTWNCLVPVHFNSIPQANCLK